MLTYIRTEAFALVIISELCSLKNRIRKIDLTQIFPINKYRNARKTITVCTSAPLRHVSSHTMITVNTFPTWVYTTRWCDAHDTSFGQPYRGPEVFNIHIPMSGMKYFL